MSNVLGIDTASVAGNKVIDWGKAKVGGVAYAIIRAAWGTSKDATFDREWPRIKQAGIVRGAYLFLRFPRGDLGAPSPEAQAEAVCKVVGALDPSDLPVALDVEFPGGASETGMTPKQLLTGVLQAWQVLRDFYGVAPLVYTSARVWLDDLKNQDVPAPVKESPLWLAKYAYQAGPWQVPGALLDPPVPPPWAGSDPTPITWRQKAYSTDNWLVHQYQGDAAGCPGFTGKVDMNRLRTLSRGSSGERVRWVQRRLGFSGPAVDGKFGPKTEAAVRSLQSDRSDLVVDGIVGSRTFAYLCWMHP